MQPCDRGAADAGVIEQARTIALCTARLYLILSAFAHKALGEALAFCKTHTFCQSCFISDGREGEPCRSLLFPANGNSEGQEYTTFPASAEGRRHCSQTPVSC